MTDREKYEQLLASRQALQASMEDGGVTDESGAIGEGRGETDVMAARRAQDQAALDAKKAQGGSEIDKAIQLATTAGAAGGNPYVAGGAVALQTLGAVDGAVRNSEQGKIDAYNKKVMAERSAIRNFMA